MGIAVLIGTNNGIVKTIDYRTAPEGRWNRQLVLEVATYLEQYVLPTADAEVVVIDAQSSVPEGTPPQIAEEIPVARRPRTEWSDLFGFGYTGGYPGGMRLQAGLTGSRNHNDVCRSRIEACLDNTLEGCARKETRR